MKRFAKTILYIILYIFAVIRGFLGLGDLTFLQPLKLRDVNKEEKNAKVAKR